MIRKSTNQLSIKPKLSREMSLGLAVLALVTSASALYFAYSYGVQSGHQRHDHDKTVISKLDQTIQGLRAELVQAQESKTFAQRQQQIQEEAYRQMSAAYASSERKNRYLGSRLDFYRSIISPEGGQSGPAIQALEYRISLDQIEFDVTLVQAIKHKHQVRGDLSVLLYSGGQGGGATHTKAGETQEENGGKLLGQWPSSGVRSVNYQYFQQESGVIELLNIPQDAKILVKLNLRDGGVLERWYDITTDQQEKKQAVSK